MSNIFIVYLLIFVEEICVSRASDEPEVLELSSVDPRVLMEQTLSLHYVTETDFSTMQNIFDIIYLYFTKENLKCRIFWWFISSYFAKEKLWLTSQWRAYFTKENLKCRIFDDLFPYILLKKNWVSLASDEPEVLELSSVDPRVLMEQTLSLHYVAENRFFATLHSAQKEFYRWRGGD